MSNHIIDANGQKLGRIASEAAKFLMGKNLVTFTRHKAPDVVVTIKNASKLLLSEKKLDEKKYPHFSGYQGGLKFEKLGALVKRRGYAEALTHAIRGMLPNNKLRPGMLKRLKISE